MRTLIASAALTLALAAPAAAAELAPGDVQQTRVGAHTTTALLEKKLYPPQDFLLVWVYRDGKLMNSNNEGSLWRRKGVIVYVDLVKGRGRLRIANFTARAHTITVRFYGLPPNTPAP